MRERETKEIFKKRFNKHLEEINNKLSCTLTVVLGDEEDAETIYDTYEDIAKKIDKKTVQFKIKSVNDMKDLAVDLKEMYGILK
jgi:hypothetical protein